ncbi:MAG: glycosyltransferase family 4 protein [Planctomycetota bacterium]|jgi:glycosyltransferase involved in cell wall biosynthesis
MSVLVVNDAYSRSSAAGAAVQMAEAVAKRGATVHFLATVQDRKEAGTFEEGGITVHRVHVHPYPVRWRAYVTLHNRPAVQALKRKLQELEPQVVHFHNLHIHFSYAALKTAARTGVPVVMTIHDVMPFCYHKMFCFLDEKLAPDQPVDYKTTFMRCMRCTRFRFNPIRNRVIRGILKRHVDRILPVSRPMAEALAQNGIPSHQVVHNGIDMDEWKLPEDGGASFRRKLGLEGSKIVFHGGRLDYLKGGLHLLRALAQARSEVPEVKLVVAGEAGLFQKEMQQHAEALDMSEALIFTGWLSGDDLKSAYAAADVVASPSLCFESFNLMNLEGMAMARPVVSSFFGGPSEVVEDGVTGFLVNPLNVKKLSDAISRILRDESLARTMGEAGRKRAEDRFHIKKTAESLLTLYENLIKGKIL